MAGKILLYATLAWPNTARYAVGFHTAGCEVIALAPTEASLCASRCLAELRTYRPFFAVTRLRSTLRKTAPEIVVPCDDRAVAHLLALYLSETARNPLSPLAAIIERSLGSPQGFDRVISRSRSLEAMANEGFCVPLTRPVASEAELPDLLKEVGLPAVLKQDGSWGGDGVVIARTHDEVYAAWRKLSRAPSRLRSLVRAIRRNDAHFLLAALGSAESSVSIQRYVSGTQAATAFAAHDGKLKAVFHYDVLVADGAMGPPRVIQRVDSDQMDAIARGVAKEFGLTGLYGLDYIRDESGKAHLIEINPRATKGGALAFGPGRDLPAALVEAFSGKSAMHRASVPSDVVAMSGHGLSPEALPPGAYDDALHGELDVHRATRPKAAHRLASFWAKRSALNHAS